MLSLLIILAVVYAVIFVLAFFGALFHETRSVTLTNLRNYHGKPEIEAARMEYERFKADAWVVARARYVTSGNQRNEYERLMSDGPAEVPKVAEVNYPAIAVKSLLWPYVIPANLITSKARQVAERVYQHEQAEIESLKILESACSDDPILRSAIDSYRQEKGLEESWLALP
jgi:hypothetical protein